MGCVHLNKNRKKKALEPYNPQSRKAATDGVQTKMASFYSNWEDSLLNLKLRLKKDTIYYESSTTLEEIMLLTIENQHKSRVPFDLVVVVDRSGSMVGSKIEVVKNTLKYLISELVQENSDSLSIVIFSDNAIELFPMQTINSSNLKILLSKIDAITPSGGTEICSGVKTALNIMQSRPSINPKSIFLFSDGLDNGNDPVTRVKTTFERYPTELIFTVDTFGFGSDHDPDLLSKIASMKNGTFYFIENLDAFKTNFTHALGGAMSVFIKNCKIKVKPVSTDVFKTSISRAYGASSVWEEKSKPSQHYITQLNHVLSGSKLNYTFGLQITPLSIETYPQEIILAKASIRFEGLREHNGRWKKKAYLKVRVYNKRSDEIPPSHEDNQVMIHYHRQNTIDKLEAAKNFADRKEYKEGRQVLRSANQALAQSEVKSEPLIQALSKEVEKTEKNMEPNIYETGGKHRLLQTISIYKYERSNPSDQGSFNILANNFQKQIPKKVQRVVKASFQRNAHIKLPLGKWLDITQSDGDSVKTRNFIPSQKEIPKLPNAPLVVKFTTKPISEPEKIVEQQLQEGVLKDNRIRITNTREWPHRVHGLILVYKGSELSGCGTGILIGSNLVLTCAHNLYDFKSQTEYTRFRFYPAMNGNVAPYGGFEVVDWYYPQEYKIDQSEDYGLMIIDSPIGDEIGYFGLQSIDASILRDETLRIFGYPGDKVEGKTEWYELWGDSGKGVEHKKLYIKYGIFTAPGMSGSGVFYSKNLLQKEEFYIVGVHVLGVKNFMGKKIYNLGTMLTKQRIMMLQEWIEDSRSSLKSNDIPKAIDLSIETEEKTVENHSVTYSLGTKIDRRIWGSDNTYTGDSFQLAAAVHSGKLSYKYVKDMALNTDIVIKYTIERPGEANYKSSISNKIKSEPYGTFSSTLKIISAKPDLRMILKRKYFENMKILLHKSNSIQLVFKSLEVSLELDQPIFTVIILVYFDSIYNEY